MRTTIRPGSVPEIRYQTVSSARPQYEVGSLFSSVAPTVVPERAAGSVSTRVALARLSFGGGAAAECAAAAVAGTNSRAISNAMTVLMGSLLDGRSENHPAATQRLSHRRVTDVKQGGVRPCGLTPEAITYIAPSATAQRAPLQRTLSASRVT